MTNISSVQFQPPTHHEVVVDPATIEFYDSFGNACINTADGQRFLLNQNSDPKPQDLKIICKRAQDAGQNLYLRFGASARNYIPEIYSMGETTLAAGSAIPVPFVTPIGPERTGTVVVISHIMGTGYVQEDLTGRMFALSDKFQNAAVFKQLVGATTIDAQANPVQGQGSKVKFRENGHNCIALIEILTP